MVWRRRTLLSGLLFLLAGATAANAGWKLSFDDEFNGDTVDRTKWRFTSRWGDRTLAGNGEKQCYQSRSVSQSDGLLRLTATRSPTVASACKGASFDLLYASGMVTTIGCNQYETAPECARLRPFSQKYGYFEIRAKLPKGKGFWPAFWLVPSDGTWPPEIDILEALGHQPSKIYQTYHYNDPSGAHQKDGHVYEGKDFTSSFSTFGIDWRPGLLIWYVDGKETFRVAGPTVTSKSMNILMNLAVGGYWPGDPDETTTFPSSMLIDYIRVYQRVDDGTPDDLPPR
ncbi:MAG: glycoside hydrolase family 16 protein [Proteobacteria bacterium]|nr:glycoside hydrolase family 16 protein [Pseudomonadota bacterium]